MCFFDPSEASIDLYSYPLFYLTLQLFAASHLIMYSIYTLFESWVHGDPDMYNTLANFVDQSTIILFEPP
jgi:hypothetical protein